MKNISDKHRDAKAAFLIDQQQKMLALYQNAGPEERAAIIRQIDGFLSVLSRDEQRFWRSVRQKLERFGENDPKKFNLAIWFGRKVRGGVQ